MAKQVVIGATLTADVKSFKAQLREAKETLLQLQDKFGEFSPEALKAANAVAHLNDKIQDSKSLVAALNPDKKFAAFGQSIQGVVGGFSALQGVMGLVGSESDNVQKSLLKVQSALALSQGLDQLKDSVQGFKNLGAIISQNVVKAFSTLRNAIITTGIGALVVALGLLIANWDKIKDKLGLVSQAQKKYNEQLNELKRTAPAVADEIADMGATAGEVADNYIKKLREETAKFNEELGLAPSRLETLNAVLDGLRAEAGGLVTDYATALSNESTGIGKLLSLVGITDSAEGLQKKIEKNQQQRVDLQKKFDENEKKRKDVEEKKKADEQKKKDDAEGKRRQEQAHQREEELKRQHDAEIEAARKLNEDLVKENSLKGLSNEEAELEKLKQQTEEKRKVLQKAGASELDLQISYETQKAQIQAKYRDEEREKALAVLDERLAREKAVSDQIILNKQKEVEAIVAAAANVVNAEGLSNQERLNVINDSEAQMLANTQLTEEQRTAIQQAFAEAREAIDENEKQTKIKNAQIVAGALDSFAQLAGRQTAVGKALAIASATINTYKAANEALASAPPPFNYIAVAAAIATGIANVRNILKVQVPGGGAPGVNIPAISGSAPLTPSLNNSTTTINPGQVAQINNQGNQAIKAFVVESDVTNNQEKIKRINRAARLG
jgi:hypothetical protein